MAFGYPGRPFLAFLFSARVLLFSQVLLSVVFFLRSRIYWCFCATWPFYHCFMSISLLFGTLFFCCFLSVLFLHIFLCDEEDRLLCYFLFSVFVFVFLFPGEQSDGAGSSFLVHCSLPYVPMRSCLSSICLGGGEAVPLSLAVRSVAVDLTRLGALVLI